MLKGQSTEFYQYKSYLSMQILTSVGGISLADLEQKNILSNNKH